MSVERSIALLVVSLLALSGRANPAPLLSVAEAKRLTDNDCQAPRAFTFTGKILSHGTQYSMFKDETGGIALHLKGISTDDIPLFSTIRATGVMRINRNGERDFLTDGCEMLHTNKPEVVRHRTCAEINSGKFDFCPVCVRGVISAVTLDEIDPRFFWFSLRDSTDDIFLTCRSSNFSATGLHELVDAEVEVSGLATTLCGLRHNLGRNIGVSDPSKISVITPAPQDPFRAPPLSTLDFSHRQKISGTVIGVAKDRFFIRTPASRIVPVLPASGTPVPRPGSAASVVGFATLDPYRILLSEALVRIEAQPKAFIEEPATRTRIEDLFRDSSKQDKISTRANGTFLVLQGISAQVDGDRLVLSSGNYSVFVDLTVCQNVPEVIPPNGSSVEVRGLCIAEFKSHARTGSYPRFSHFTLYPSSAADIRTLSRPPWWTPLKFLFVIASLGIFLIVILIWNRALRSVSERRGRELYEEKIDHALAEQKVEERTRLAVELHDSVSQTLTGIALQLDGGEIETAKTMLASCRGELRRCLWDLRSRTFEEKDMTEAVTRTITPHLNGCTATVRFNVPRERLSESLTHTILRIVRELVVNAIRHGQAKHIKIAGEMHGDTVSFSVADDGIGFTPETAPGPRQGHFGLLGIRERIEDFDGSLKIVSSPEQGAKFTVTLTTTAESNER